ncbi:MAG: CBS domain-containing protein [Desulfocapsaceae bacterium]|nr:CBS domain-containing protein [Desulfocapsaceae bacterium]
MKYAREIMTKDVLTVQPQKSVNDLANLLTTQNINGVPVVDEEGKLMGVVTENDLVFQKKKVHIPTVINILDSFIYLESQERMKKEMAKITGVTVESIYSKDVKTVRPETPIDEIATLMVEENIHTIPVVDDGELVGVIGKRDIIRSHML